MSDDRRRNSAYKDPLKQTSLIYQVDTRQPLALYWNLLALQLFEQCSRERQLVFRWMSREGCYWVSVLGHSPWVNSTLNHPRSRVRSGLLAFFLLLHLDPLARAWRTEASLPGLTYASVVFGVVIFFCAEMLCAVHSQQCLRSWVCWWQISLANCQHILLGMRQRRRRGRTYCD